MVWILGNWTDGEDEDDEGEKDVYGVADQHRQNNNRNLKQKNTIKQNIGKLFNFGSMRKSVKRSGWVVKHNFFETFFGGKQVDQVDINISIGISLFMLFAFRISSAIQITVVCHYSFLPLSFFNCPKQPIESLLICQGKAKLSSSSAVYLAEQGYTYIVIASILLYIAILSEFKSI